MYIDWDNIIKWQIIATVIFLVCGLVVGACVSINTSMRLMDSCLKDGHKEYECHAMIYGGGRLVSSAPIFIPMGK